MINFILGSLFGIGIMCLLQINRDNELKKENKRLKEEYVLLQNASNEYEDGLQARITRAIEYIGNKNIGIPRKTREKAIKILGGDVDDE